MGCVWSTRVINLASFPGSFGRGVQAKEVVLYWGSLLPAIFSLLSFPLTMLLCASRIFVCGGGGKAEACPPVFN